MIVRPRSGSPLIGAAMRQRRCMEGVDGGPVRRQEGDMAAIAYTGRLAIERRQDPDLRTARRAIAGVWFMPTSA